MNKLFPLFLLFLSVAGTTQAQQMATVQAAMVAESKPKTIAPLDRSAQALGITTQTKTRLSKIANPPLNIALFAVDRRDQNENGNSDVIMIISIDQLTKKVKLSSILRDTYVNIEGHPKDKINAAFSIGGPQLAIKTLNQNFGLDIKDYINIDFFGAAKIINALGGIQVNLKSEEIPYLNNYLHEIAIIDKEPEIPVSNPGLQVLDGKQAVAYTRIRAVGRGDFERTERQRTVMIGLFKKLKESGPDLYPVMMSQVLPNMETSMPTMSLFKVGSDLMGSKSKVIEQARFPLDSSSKGIRVNNIWYLSADMPVTTTAMHNFIYKNIQPGK